MICNGDLGSAASCLGDEQDITNVLYSKVAVPHITVYGPYRVIGAEKYVVIRPRKACLRDALYGANARCSGIYPN